ncbi:MAG: DNA polymerase III subunit delta' [Pseudomonadota bacterium]
MTDLPWLEDPWHEFAARYEQGRLPHAMLVTGPAGTGKRKLAERMVHGLLCERETADACGVCRSCTLRAGGAHPDLFIVRPEEGKREIVIDSIRLLNERLVLTTTISPRKVALVEPADAMNRATANAFLKSLEEPPGDAAIILVADDAARLLPTIRSRCQLLPVRLPGRAAARDWLTQQSDVDAGEAELALEATAGSPLRAQALIEAGELERFVRLRDELEALIGKPSRASGLAEDLQSVAGDSTWTWLGLAAGRALRGVLGAGSGRWPVTDYALPASRIAELQARANQYRRLLASTARQDLLLREWLLEWARLPAKEPIR